MESQESSFCIENRKQEETVRDPLHRLFLFYGMAASFRTGLFFLKTRAPAVPLDAGQCGMGFFELFDDLNLLRADPFARTTGSATGGLFAVGEVL